MNSSSLQVGDAVRFIDEPGQGTIIKINEKHLIIDLDGLEVPFEANEVVKIEHDHLLENKTTASDISASDKLRRLEGRQKLKALDDAIHTSYELDLHIHELLDRFDHMSNGEILKFQMNKCRAFVKEAIQKRFPKIILIHGVGEGVLRTEIHQFLDRIDHVSYHDAPYRTYGYGATEVVIHR